MWRGKSKQNDEEVVKVHSRRKGGTRSSLYWAYIRARFLEYQRIRQILWFYVWCFCYQKRSKFHQNVDGRQQGLEGAPVAPYHKINDWFNIWYLSNLTVHVIFFIKKMLLRIRIPAAPHPLLWALRQESLLGLKPPRTMPLLQVRIIAIIIIIIINILLLCIGEHWTPCKKLQFFFWKADTH